MERFKQLASGVLATSMGLTALLGLSGCSEETAPTGSLELKVISEAYLTSSPLGDAVLGRLHAGERVAAICIVSDAQTNTGARGDAVRIADTENLYAPTTTFESDMAKRHNIFSLSSDEIAKRIPEC